MRRFELFFRANFSIGFFFVFKVDARSVERLENLNIGLENKIIELQQRVDRTVTIFWPDRTFFGEGTNKFSLIFDMF